MPQAYLLFILCTLLQTCQPFSHPVSLDVATSHFLANHTLRVDTEPLDTSQNSSTPLPLSVRHINATASKSIRFELATVRPNEQVQQVTYTVSDPSVITNVTLTPVRRKGINNRWSAAAHLSMDGSVGTSIFTITARTDNPHLIYSKTFLVTVAGISVNIQRETVSGIHRTGILLGTFRSWLHLRQIAIPLKVQPEKDHSIHPVNSRTALSLIPLDPTRSQVVDAIRFYPDQCSSRVETAISQQANNNLQSSMTLFINESSTGTIGSAHLPPDCGMGMSSDASWLIIRLEPYRVAAYGFRVQITWLPPDADGNDGASDPFFPNHVILNFRFDDIAVPPPLMQNLTASLDPFGGELLRIPVSNIFSPPRHLDLSASDFVLQLQSADGTSQNSSAMLISQDGKYPEVHFDTPAWKNQDKQILTLALLFHERGSMYESLSGTRTSTEDIAILSPDASVTITLQSGALAQLDSCQVDGQYDSNRFIRVELGVRQYQADTFSAHKNKQIMDQIGAVFDNVSPTGIRFVDQGDGMVTYAVLTTRAEDSSLAARIANLEKRISQHSLAFAVMLHEEDITANRIVIEETSLCSAFPRLAGVEPEGRVNGSVDGLQTWGLVLVILGGIVALMVLVLIVLKIIGWFKWSGDEVSPAWSIGGAGTYEAQSGTGESMWIETESSILTDHTGRLVDRVKKWLPWIGHKRQDVAHIASVRTRVDEMWESSCE